ncbi:MAG: hypothetical protein HY736_27115 [Verrucomicrobia bacterium]|nr:hypothetical protein [Verrucomicrobiota bacterium]
MRRVAHAAPRAARPDHHGSTTPRIFPHARTPPTSLSPRRIGIRPHDLRRRRPKTNAAAERGQVILAGRTLESGDKTFGLVIFEAADADATRAFMASDPSVAEKIMTAELHPNAVALRAK